MRLSLPLCSSIQSYDMSLKSDVFLYSWFRDSRFNLSIAVFAFLCTLLNMCISNVYSSQFTPLAVHFPYFQQTKLSPLLQDQRWENFKKLYCMYQANLTATKENHYVLYSTTYSGIANKIDGLVSSLLIAMLTNRGLKRMGWETLYF